MKRAGSWLLRIVLTIGLVVLCAGYAPVAQADPTAVTPVNDAYDPVVVVLDTSSSMTDTDDRGTQRIVGARSAVLGLVDALAPQSQFALIAYPGNGGRIVDGCSEGKVEIKLDPLDQPTASAAVRRLSPDGDTPTAPALRHAARLIMGSPTQKGTVVLVSDGESNCGSTDVCAVAQELSEQGVEIRVNTVGFQISDEGQDELTCISQATGGWYVDAENDQQLQDALQDLSGARLTLEAAVPDPLPVVSGTGVEGPKAVLTVTNSGKKTARDVRLSLDFRDDGGKPGAVLVPRPIRFLGNLEPDQKRVVEITVRPDAARKEQFSWVATATADNAVPQRREGETTTAEPKLDGLLAGADNIAVLGDSYSSGEGARDYDAGTNGGSGADDNYCHRSKNAYGRKLLPNAELIACSGAVTADFYKAQRTGHLVEPQLRRLRRVATSDRSPDAVLLSIGGNDVDFVGTVAACILGAPGQTCTWDGAIEEQKFRADAASRIAGVADSLRRVYRDVNRAINDPTARARRGGKYAPIIVVPYPRIVPSTHAGSAAARGCNININANEVDFFNSFIDMLNVQIGAVAGSMRSQHIPVYVASDVVSAFQPNHTICDGSNSYANFTVNPLEVRNSEMLHPNADGNAAMARAISAWSAGRTMMSDPAPVEWHSIDTKQPVFDAPLSLADLGLVGGQASVKTEGFDPKSTVVFRLDSTPRILGSATTTDEGTIDTHVSLPVDVAPGEHQLHVLGLSNGAEMRDVVSTIRLGPPQSLAAVVGLVVGAVALVLGLIGFRKKRRLAEAG